MSPGRPGRVERDGHRAVPVRAQPDVLRADDADRVDDRAGDGRRVAPAGGRVPEADAHQPAGRGDPAQLVVGEVAPVVGRRADAGVRRDDGARGHAHHVVDRGGRRVGHVRDQAARLHLADELAAERRQPALGDPVRRPAVRRVEEVRGRDHAEARLDHRVERREVGAQRVRALDREHARREARIGRPRLQVRREVLAGADEPERALRPGGQPVRPVREEQGARGQAPPRAGRPAGGDGHARHVVAAVVVALDVEVARRLHRGREHLERDAALDHARHVEVATGPAHEQVAAEQQRVRVQVDRPDRRVEGERTLGGVGRRGRDRVQAPLDAADQVIEHRAGGRQAGDRGRAPGDRDPAPGAHAPNARPRVGRIQSGML